MQIIPIALRLDKDIKRNETENEDSRLETKTNKGTERIFGKVKKLHYDYFICSFSRQDNRWQL